MALLTVRVRLKETRKGTETEKTKATSLALAPFRVSRPCCWQLAPADPDKEWLQVPTESL